MTTYQCPVCGFDGLEDPAYGTEGEPSHEICESCGFQFGFSDQSQGYTFEQWREAWVRDGCRWQSVGVPQPEGWNATEQLRNVAPPTAD